MTGQYPPHGHYPVTVCVRHPDRETGLRCTRCNRPACPECLREAAVGYQCVDCVAAGRRTTRSATTVAGARFTGQTVVVPALIAANLVIFAITGVQAGSFSNNANSELFAQWGLIPPLLADGELWRLVTSGFLHFGPVHLAFNMLALWIIGRDLELVLGRSRFLAVYLVSLLGGSAAVFLLENVDSNTAGASGAVYGLMGGLAVLLRRLRHSPGPALGIIAVNVFISLVIPQISLLGHLGGLVFGTAATAAMVYAPPRQRTPIQVGALLVLLAVVAAVVVVRDLQLA